MSQSETINELAAALALAQAKMPPARFNQTNPFLHSEYADLGAVIEASRAVLADNGLAVSQLVIGGDGSVGVETILMHKSGQWIASAISLPTGDEKGKSQAQVAGSIISYLRRYSLASMLGIYADKDDDGNKPAASPAKNVALANPLAPPPAEQIELLPHEYRDGTQVDENDPKEIGAFDRYLAKNDGAHPPTRTTLRAWAKAQTQTN
jgi:hypothetical protein